VAETAAVPAFDVAEATKHLAERDERLKRLIEETVPFQLKIEAAHSPYETLLEAVTHQSISGKAAATIFARVKALSSTGGIPTPQEMLKLRKPALRKAGLSAAKILAMKDLAQKTIEGVVPTLEQAQKLSDEELVKRLVSVRGIGDWTVGLVGRNLMTFSNYSGYDPEVGVVGGQSNSGLINQVDAFDFPTLRSFTFSLSTRF